jgi:hypothetical protein
MSSFFERLEQENEQLNTTLARVRAQLTREWAHPSDRVRWALEALAGQPEAPKGCCCDGTQTYCPEHGEFEPQAPKGQETGPIEQYMQQRQLQDDLAAAKAQIAELKELTAALIAANEAGTESLNAANARNIALSEKYLKVQNLRTEAGNREAAANARADAAGRKHEFAVIACTRLETERNQLAARVRELETFVTELGLELP